MPLAHPDLAADLDLATYTSVLYETSSVQTCRAKGARLGDAPAIWIRFHSATQHNRLGCRGVATKSSTLILALQRAFLN